MSLGPSKRCCLQFCNFFTDDAGPDDYQHSAFSCENQSVSVSITLQHIIKVARHLI